MATTTKVSESSIAAAFLTELGAPNTPAMRGAVIAWMRAESGHTIIGGNPFNMRPGAGDAGTRIGTRTSINGNGTFSVYASPIVGAQVAADRLKGTTSYGYPAVVKAAKTGSAVAFLNALAHSQWSGNSHYGMGLHFTGANRLLAVYKTVGTPGSDTLQAPANFNPLGGGGPVRSTGSGTSATGVNDPTTITGGNLGAWASQVNFPIGHVLTAQDVQSIMSTLVGNGWFAGDSTGAAQAQTETVLNGEIGKTWNKALEQDIQSKLMTDATTANPLGGLGAIAGDFAQVLGALFDPRKWILFLALLAGAAMTAWGGANVLRAAQ